MPRAASYPRGEEMGSFGVLPPTDPWFGAFLLGCEGSPKLRIFLLLCRTRAYSECKRLNPDEDEEFLDLIYP